MNNNEIDYKSIFLEDYKNKYLDFPFINEMKIENEVNNVDERLKLFSNVISFNNDLIKEINKKSINSFSIYNKLKIFVKHLNSFNQTDELNKEYELLKYLIININNKLDQDDIDEIEYKICDVCNYYDNAEILSYMFIENDLYYEIASHIREEEKEDNIDTLLILLNNKNLTIHNLTKTAAIKYFGGDVKESTIEELVEEVIKTYYKDKSFIEHTKETVLLSSQKENEKKYFKNK